MSEVSVMRGGRDAQRGADRQWAWRAAVEVRSEARSAGESDAV